MDSAMHVTRCIVGISAYKYGEECCLLCFYSRVRVEQGTRDCNFTAPIRS